MTAEEMMEVEVEVKMDWRGSLITLNLVVQRGWGVADWQAAGFVWLPAWREHQKFSPAAA